MHYQLNGIQYKVSIVGTGPPLLLLHGFTGSHTTWKPFIPALSEHFQTIAVDLLGHGETEAPPNPSRYTIDNVAKDIITLLDKMDIEKAHVLGYSMGGRLAFKLASHYPSRVATLTLESSSPGLKTERKRKERRQSDEKLATFLEKEGLKAFVDYWQDIPLFQTQKRVELDKRERLRKQRLQNRVVGLANSLRGMGTGAQPSFWSHAPTLSMPVLLIVGALDQKYVAIAKELYEQIPQAQLTIVKDAGHTVHFERENQFLTIALQFLLQF